MNIKKKVFRPIFLFVLDTMLIISVLGLESCNEEACEDIDTTEIVIFEETEVGAPISTIATQIDYGTYVEGCGSRITCVPSEIRFSLFGKSNLGGEEELLETVRLGETVINDRTREGGNYFLYELLSLNTPPNYSYRLVLEADTPNCTRERQGFTYEFNFQTPLIEELQGIVYELDLIQVNDMGKFSSGNPTEPLNEYFSPLNFEIVSVSPASGAEYISIPDSSVGQLVADNLINAGKGKYVVDVKVSDPRGIDVLLEDAITFEVIAAPGEITWMRYEQPLYINPDSPASVNSDIPLVEGVGSFDDYTFAFTPLNDPEVNAILPYLSLDPTSGVVTLSDAQTVITLLEQYSDTQPVNYVRIPLDVTNAVGTYQGYFYLTAHIWGMAYNPYTLTVLGSTTVSSNAPIILNPDPAGYRFEYEPVYDYISIDPDTGVITVSGEGVPDPVGVRILEITAFPNSGGRYKASLNVRFN